MIYFTIITSTPAALANILVNQNVLKQITDEFGTRYVGVFEGLEWVEVPNPMFTRVAVGDPEKPGYVTPIMDSRHCYLVKLVRAAESNQKAGQPTIGDLLHTTKLGNWILANSVVDTLTSADGRSWPCRRVGTNFWGVISPDFGVWQ